MDVKISFVVRNLETDFESSWIELDTMTEEEAREAFYNVVDTRFDWEIVDFESNFSLDYYKYQYASFETIYSDFTELQNAITDDMDALIVQHLLSNENVSIEDLRYNMDRMIFAEVESDHEDLGRAAIEETGFPRELERYFDYEEFGEAVIDGGFLEEMEEYTDVYDRYASMSSEKLGETYVFEIYGDLENLDKSLLKKYFNYEAFGRDIAFEFNYVEIDNLYGWVSDN